jgi:uncharacterized protein
MTQPPIQPSIQPSMQRNQAQPHLILMAKAPLPGLAKTRLIPTLGEQGSARLAAWLLAHSLQHAQTAQRAGWLRSLEICITPSAEHWPPNSLPTAWQISQQAQGDLGERMGQAARTALAQGPVILIGTDCPGLSAEHLGQAAASLARHSACLIPATDGGYCLLGLTQWLPQLFTHMPWSTNRVAAITRQRLEQAGVDYHCFAPLTDIDTAENLSALPEPAQHLLGPAFTAAGAQTPAA